MRQVFNDATETDVATATVDWRLLGMFDIGDDDEWSYIAGSVSTGLQLKEGIDSHGYCTCKHSHTSCA